MEGRDVGADLRGHGDKGQAGFCRVIVCGPRQIEEIRPLDVDRDHRLVEGQALVGGGQSDHRSLDQHHVHLGIVQRRGQRRGRAVDGPAGIEGRIVFEDGGEMTRQVPMDFRLHPGCQVALRPGRRAVAHHGNGQRLRLSGVNRRKGGGQKDRHENHSEFVHGFHPLRQTVLFTNGWNCKLLCDTEYHNSSECTCPSHWRNAVHATSGPPVTARVIDGLSGLLRLVGIRGSRPDRGLPPQ